MSSGASVLRALGAGGGNEITGWGPGDKEEPGGHGESLLMSSFHFSNCGTLLSSKKHFKILRVHDCCENRTKPNQTTQTLFSLPREKCVSGCLSSQSSSHTHGSMNTQLHRLTQIRTHIYTHSKTHSNTATDTYSHRYTYSCTDACPWIRKCTDMPTSGSGKWPSSPHTHIDAQRYSVPQNPRHKDPCAHMPEHRDAHMHTEKF